MDLKHVVVVDDDIDVNDPTEVEWAIATRVQGDKDVMIVSNARAKPLDPSLPQGYGVVPTGAKVGIDATIPEGIPHEYYERITYAYADRARIGDYVNGKADAAGQTGDETAVADASPHRYSRRSARSRSITPISRSTFLRTISTPSPRALWPSAHDRETLAGPARAHVRARVGFRRQAAAPLRKCALPSQPLIRRPVPISRVAPNGCAIGSRRTRLPEPRRAMSVLKI